MAITIKDVAKQAEVSAATVSRVIADNPRISAKTKQKVRETMELLGYYPNFQARNLVAQKTRTIGVIMANSTTLAFQNPFFPEVLRGISASAHKSQYGLYLSTGATEDEIFDEVVAMDQGKRVDGIILLYSKVNDRIMDYLFQCGLPFSVVGRPHTNADAVSYVDNDNISITKQVIGHLTNLGHKRIAFIAGGKDFVVSLDRLQGYEEALADSLISFDPQYIVNQEGMQQDGKRAIRQLFDLENPPTAIVAHDDLVAYEVIGYLEDLQINVPEDVSIISFNNHALSKHLKPPLSSVDICIYELGIEAANLLLEKINDEKAEPRQITVSSRLIERGSCQGR